MIAKFFNRRRENASLVERIYEQIVSQARQPAYYSHYGGTDTVLGRFEVLALRMVLVVRRMQSGSASLSAMSQDLTDRFFQDIDHSMRELGIGDRGIPRRMKTFAGLFYGRAKAYGGALDAGDGEAMTAALRRNFYGVSQEGSLGAPLLSDHVFASAKRLQAQQDSQLLQAQLDFCEPDPVEEVELGDDE